jgi:hypothetical protein
LFTVKSKDHRMSSVPRFSSALQPTHGKVKMAAAQ